jgi:hypothetical protein
MILLQTSPRSMKSALSKCLREASSVEGVLECHHEHFWSLGSSLSLVVGTMKVRVSKNADEQMVLSQVHKIFSPLLSHLTIQVEKNDWEFKSENLLFEIPQIENQITNSPNIEIRNRKMDEELNVPIIVKIDSNEMNSNSIQIELIEDNKKVE